MRCTVSRPGRLLLTVMLNVMLFCCVVWPCQAAPLLLVDLPQPVAERDLRLVLEKVSDARAEVINLQRELVSRPAVGPEHGGTGEEAKARWIEAWLTGHGAACERLDFPDDRVPAKVRPNIIALYPQSGGTTDKPRTLWLVSHLDVAAPGPRGLWKGDPFALRVEGDAIYGRGVEDNNQAIASSLLLLKSLHETGVKPPLRLGLILASGALFDYSIGIEHVLSKKPEIFGPDDRIVVLDYGNVEGSLFGVSEKGNLWLKITVDGKAGHAGTPDDANNAFAAGAALARGLRDLERAFPLENSLFSPPRVTITPTRTEDFCTGINHIPSRFVFYADVRVTPEYSFATVEKALRGLADEVARNDGVTVSIERVEETPPARVTPCDAPVLVSLDKAVRTQLGVVPKKVGTGSVTMAAILRDRGLHVAVWAVQETLHNRPEEHSLISAHIKQAQVLARLLFDAPEKAGDTAADRSDK